MRKKPSSISYANSSRTYKNRVAGIKKKAMELAVLCDIKVCTVIMGPNGEIETWPDNQNEIRSLINKYFEQEKVRTAKNKELPPPKKPRREEIEDVDLVKSLDSKIDAIYAKIDILQKRAVQNGATEVSEIENPQKFLDVIDLDQCESENPEKFLDFLDIDVDVDLAEDEGNSTQNELSEEEAIQNESFLGSGFSHWDEFSTDCGDWEGSSTGFRHWDRLCADWEKNVDDYGEWDEIFSDLLNRDQIPNPFDSDSDRMPQLQNSDFDVNDCENPSPAGYEFPQLPLEDMEISMTEFLQCGDFTEWNFGNFDCSPDRAEFNPVVNTQHTSQPGVAAEHLSQPRFLGTFFLVCPNEELSHARLIQRYFLAVD